MGDFIIPGNRRDRKQDKNSEDKVYKDIKLFREWLNDKRQIFLDTQCYDDATLLESIISMYDDVFDYALKKES